MSVELALNDAEAAIKADPTWLLGYYTKAASLAELDRKQQALAAAAVFKHLSSGRDVPAVTERYGGLQVHVVESSDELSSFLQRIKKLERVNQVVIIKEGEYSLERSVEITQPLVIVGQGKVKVSCKIGAPFHFTQEGYVENVEIVGDCANQQESKDCIANNAQSEVITLATPPGYEHNNECKVATFQELLNAMEVSRFTLLRVRMIYVVFFQRIKKVEEGEGESSCSNKGRRVPM
ncbi:hypothetical protein ACROYT_G023587 [Oculina patagonica]